MPSAQLPRTTAALAGNAYEDADREPAREHEGAAVAEEGERDSRDWHEVDRHADVLQHVHEPAREQAECDETAEGVVGAFGDPNHAQEKREKEHDPQRDADEAELLADDRPDEIRVLGGQERESFLRAVQVALAEPSAGTDRDL